jgi:uncharacterized protein (DUF927 family)
VTIWPDHDEAGRAFAVAVAQLARAAGAKSIRIVDVSENFPAKWDLADDLPPGITRDDLRRLLDTAPLARSFVSFGNYRSTAEGLFYDYPKDKAPLRLCGPLEVIAETRDAGGENWGIVLRWQDDDGQIHEHALARATLAGDGADARRTLQDGGLFVSPLREARDHLNAYLAQVQVEPRARAVTRIGWHPSPAGGRVFVLPDIAIGDAGGEMIRLQPTPVGHAFRMSGTLAEWQQKIARLCVGNSRLTFAASMAFAAPLLEVVAEESGGVHLRGQSGTGKSTALRVAGSVCGGGGVNGFVRQWRATSNGLESTAELHSDALLCLDEMGQVDAREAGEIAYMLANGSGKSRAARDGGVRRSAQWRLLFISSGEISLTDKMGESGRRAKAGQEVRLVDVSADAGAGRGLFETLHNFGSAEAFARHLGEASRRYYGTALRPYLQRLTARLSADASGLIAMVRERRQKFIENNVAAGADGQVLRVAGRFALIAAAGELATAFGITGWPDGEAERAAAVCFRA